MPGLCRQSPASRPTLPALPASPRQPASPASQPAPPARDMPPAREGSAQTREPDRNPNGTAWNRRGARQTHGTYGPNEANITHDKASALSSHEERRTIIKKLWKKVKDQYILRGALLLPFYGMAMAIASLCGMHNFASCIQHGVDTHIGCIDDVA